jgi:hypothetical protein
MQARNETMTAGHDEARKGEAGPTTRERTPRFKLIKLEERIAPGGIVGTSTSAKCNHTGSPTYGVTCNPCVH